MVREIRLISRWEEGYWEGLLAVCSTRLRLHEVKYLFQESRTALAFFLVFLNLALGA